MQKRKVLSLEWKSEGVTDDESGELIELVEEMPLKELGDCHRMEPSTPRKQHNPISLIRECILQK